MLLSVLCADECGVVWPYVLGGNDKLTGVSLAAGTVETLRAEFAAVVEERRRRDPCRPVLVADLHVLQRENAEQSNQIAVLNDIVSGQASQIAEQTNQIAGQTNQIAEQTNQIAGQTIKIDEQTNQIADLQRSTETIVKQNQQMQEQMRQMHALLMSREREPSADDDEGDRRAVKRRRTGR
jgi:methyl-accepting chemotaxis protein